MKTLVAGRLSDDLVIAKIQVESHIRERLDQIDPSPDEHAACEHVLREVGPPLRVA